MLSDYNYNLFVDLPHRNIFVVDVEWIGDHNAAKCAKCADFSREPFRKDRESLYIFDIYLLDYLNN